MDLTHEFDVPTSVAETWTHFQDIAALAECFPGATVTSVDTVDGVETFTGSCKVKLGPIALVYQGSGSFVERDEGAHRFVVAAKGKDKRGNGTAGADVTLTMAEADGGTRVVVVTDLAITGKPAQFGRGVMQDVSDKLLGQFVTCLEQRLAGPDPAATEPAAEERAPATEEPAVEEGTPAGLGEVGAEATPASPDPEPAGAAEPRHAAPRPVAPRADEDDALDLGATVLPVLLRTYGKQVLGALAGLLVLGWVVRRIRR